MKKRLSQLEQWLEEHYQDLAQDFLPPAEEDALEGLEEELANKLPEDYKALMRWHDGQNGEAAGLFGNWEFLPLEDVLQEWQLWKDLNDKGHFDEQHPDVRPDGPVKKRWWHPAWIPITADGMGNNHCLDLAPEKTGNYGQIITLFHDNEVRRVVAPSLEQWIADILENLDNGNYRLVLDKEVDDYFFEPEGFID